jgi:Icc-related predicted phosphoesterase
MLKIVCISDTHSYHRRINIPDGDVLVVSGDLTWKGELSIVEDFANWIKEVPIANKIVIFGNHELGFQHGPKRKDAIKLIKNSGAHYLEDSGITIDGVKFWGSPATPWFHSWEWNYQRGKDIAMVWDKIPLDTNVLITHGPPYMIMDEAPRGVFGHENVGCSDLLSKISELTDLKLHVFGHIHHGYGKTQMGPCAFVNASSCTEQYAPTNPPIVVEI